MGILDSFRKNKEEQKQKENPTTPPPAGHALKEILADKGKSHLFFELLGRDGEVDLAQRLLENKLDEGDIDVIEEKREIFSKKITKSEEIEKLLTAEVMIELARNNSDFKKVVNTLTPEGAAKVIQSRLKEIAITDEGRFDIIASKVETKESFKDGAYKKTEEKVEKFLEEKGITSDEYLEVMAIKDPKEKKEALKQLSYRTNGGFKRAINSISGGRLAKDTTLKELEKSEITLQLSNDALNTLNKDIGSALFMSVNENKDMRNALSSELVGEKVPNEPKVGFKELRKETLDEVDHEESWIDEKRKTGYNRANIPPEVKETIQREFRKKAKDYYKKQHEGKGFLHTLILAMILGLIDKKKLE